MSNDPPGNMRTFVPNERRVSIVETDRAFCSHLKVDIDEDAHTVICQLCEKQLDPFTFLVILKREWKHRAYRDDRVIAAAAVIKQQQLDAMARGRLFQKPTQGAALRAWNNFEQFLGREPFSIYRRGASWYAAEEDGSHYLEDYALMCIRKAEMKRL